MEWTMVVARGEVLCCKVGEKVLYFCYRKPFEFFFFQ